MEDLLYIAILWGDYFFMKYHLHFIKIMNKYGEINDAFEWKNKIDNDIF